MTLVDWLTIVLLMLPVIDWTAALALHRFTRWFPHLRTARERRRVAVAIAVLSTMFAVLGLARLGHVDIDDQLAAVAIVSAVVLLSGVNLAFLWTYRHALLRRTPPPEPPEEEPTP